MLPNIYTLGLLCLLLLCDVFTNVATYFTEGYTSISVREPLANIIAQTKAMNRLKRDLDPHYATVSDDSGSSRKLHVFKFY